ncbi:alpha/beta hydrolase [Kitasatospora cheerisanensis KCTC 2395]|uniref:Alpha/beta hydrolase n=2 Tax=Kitasatospora cheerisanensis TaxID=81942 RepID=A0A066YUI3_9ACTN|nr:alpha/beta hydrolase [Kitasatospora cheerisanensis KCTC 2395]
MTWDGLVRVRGGDVWAADSGGDRPPLVLLHPGVGDSRIWDGLLPELTRRHRVIRYDVRGYGRSPRPTTAYSNLADLYAVLDHFGLHRVHLVGCSMGGGTALGLALRQPERAASLVLVCPGVPGYPWPAEPEADAEYDRLVAADDLDGLTAFGLREWAAAGSDPAAVAQLRSAARAWPGEDLHQQPDPPVFGRLGELTGIPATVLIGDLDRRPAIDCAEQTAARLRCELLRLPGVDHLPPLRTPDAILRVIDKPATR